MNFPGRLTAWWIISASLLLACIVQKSANAGTIASKRQKNVMISITSDSRKFVEGRNNFCVSFTDGPNAPSVPVTNVFIEFAQQVGKIREKPLTTVLKEDTVGRYCGEINLGVQYYHPAVYHVTIHYVDASGKKWTCHMMVSID